MKRPTTTLIAVIAMCMYAEGQNSLPTTPIGQVEFHQTFTLNHKVDQQQAYEMVQSWFTQSPSKFTRKNTGSALEGVETSNKHNVDLAFNNSTPLQSLDPESGRVSGRALVKYFGNAGNSIRVLYIEYYLVVQVTGNRVDVTVTQMKYHHFNQNYASAAITNWQGGRPCDANNNIEELLASNISSSDISHLTGFLNSDTHALLNDLGSYLNNHNALAANN